MFFGGGSFFLYYFQLAVVHIGPNTPVSYYGTLQTVCRVSRVRVAFRVATYQMRSKRPARVPPQDTTVSCDLLPNAQLITSRPSQQSASYRIHRPGRHASYRLLADRVTLSLLPSVCSGSSIFVSMPFRAHYMIPPYSYRTNRSYQTLSPTTARVPYSRRM